MEEGLGQLVGQFFSSAWSDAVVWFGGLWAVLLFIRKVFKDADNELDPEKRQFLAEELARNKNWASGSWIPDFTLVFDRFFGKKHLRWRCISRSILISLISFFVLIWLTTTGTDSYMFREPLIIVILWAVLFNPIADYLSLLETRILLNTPLPTSIKILVDIFLTFLIAIGWMAFVNWPFDDLSYLEAVREIWKNFDGRDRTEGSIIVLLTRIVVATSFTTSIWLWLHGLAQLMIGGLSTAGYLMSWLNVKERPLRAIGTTVNAFVLLIGVVLFAVFGFAA